MIARAPTNTPRPILIGRAFFRQVSSSVVQPHSPAGQWKSLSSTRAPAPKIVSSPISMDDPAHSTVPLRPTDGPRIRLAPEVIVRRTQGWKLARGFARKEL